MLDSIINKLNYDFLRSFGNTSGGKPQFNIGIAGLPASGKTNYVAVALETLQNPVIKDKKGNINNFLAGLKSPAAVYKNPTDEYRQIVNSIYVNKKPEDVAGTSISEDRVIEFINDKKRYEIKLIDTKGGDFADNKFENAFFKNSEAFIITIDPLSILEVHQEFAKNKFTPGDIRAVSGYSHNNIPIAEALNNFSTRLKDRNKPLAIVFTKCDLILNDSHIKLTHLGSASNIYRANTHIIESGTVSLEKIRDSSREVEDLLKKLNLISLVNLMPTISKQYMFFAASSYGERKKNGEIEEIKPHRVLDPLLWLLKLRGFL